jgi:ABC-2 type transport system ATP-binding protein
MDKIIEVKKLSYHYGNFKVLDNIDLLVHTNSIFGFLGPNGAGKTTTIKILLGLLSTPKNNVFLFNKEIRSNRIEILSKTGSLVESPSLYHHLTASENLHVLVTLLNLKKSKIDEVLETVGLRNVANKKAGKFSTGMKQRLGIAKAMLTDPDLIILDEPTTGLDPNGIIEIRNLLKLLKNDFGKTIFLSSHQLSEVEKICTHVGIINEGKILFQGSKDALNELNSTSLKIDVSNQAKFLEMLKKQQIEFSTTANNKFIIPFESDTATSKFIHDLVNEDIGIYSVEKTESTLEDLFIKIINN